MLHQQCMQRQKILRSHADNGGRRGASAVSIRLRYFLRMAATVATKQMMMMRDKT